MNKSYIGDGVYIEYDQGDIILTTENGIAITNRIILENDVLNNLIEYVARSRVLVTFTEPKEKS